MDIGACAINNINPISLPLAKNLVSDGSSSTKYGIAFSLSSNPNQLFSFMPSFSLNNSFVVNENYCADGNYTCIAAVGGTYSPPSSAPLTQDPQAWNGTQGSDVTVGDQYNERLYNDLLSFQGHNIDGFPFYTYEVEGTGYSAPACLALGFNSSFLNAALDAKLIGTQAWSYWPGVANNIWETDGLLVLGGYDADRAAGEFSTYQINETWYDGSPVPFFVSVTDIEWQYSAGNSLPLMPNTSTSIGVSLDPFQDYMAFPYDTVTALVNAFNATYNYTTSGYRFSGLPTGNMIITLSDGSKTIIPPEDLFDYPTGFSTAGEQIYSAYQYQGKFYSGYDAPTASLTFGIPFLSQKLFVADVPRGVFHMANANKQNFGSPGPRNLQPLCTQVDEPTPAPNSTNTNDTPQAESKKTNVAAIAGGVGGGVGALLIIAAVIFFLRRRKNKQNQEEYVPEVSQPTTAYPAAGVMGASPPPKYPNSGIYETNESGMPVRYQSPPPKEAPVAVAAGAMSPGSPRSDAGGSTGWGTTTYGGSQVGGYNNNNNTYPGTNHEMSSQNRFQATSGPLEMPGDYDHRH